MMEVRDPHKDFIGASVLPERGASKVAIIVLNPNDKIVGVSGPWQKVALQRATIPIEIDRVYNRNITDFVQGVDTRSFLSAIFFSCRKTGYAFEIPYRCDGSTMVRVCSMHIQPKLGGFLQIRHSIMYEQPFADPLHIIKTVISADRQCSICQKVQLGGTWHDPKGLDKTIFKPSEFVVCPSCKQRARRALAKPAPPPTL
jgi:hypothetical protein